MNWYKIIFWLSGLEFSVSLSDQHSRICAIILYTFHEVTRETESSFQNTKKKKEKMLEKLEKKSLRRWELTVVVFRNSFDPI